MVHVSSVGSRMTIYPSRKAQLAMLLGKEVTVPTKYLDFADVFLEKSANVLSERIKANKHVIKLEKGKQPPYGPIYSLEPIELKILITYIETNLANGFIRVSTLAKSRPGFRTPRVVRGARGDLSLSIGPEDTGAN